MGGLRWSVVAVVVGVAGSVASAQMVTPPTDAEKQVSPEFKGFPPKQAPVQNTDAATRSATNVPAAQPQEPLPEDLDYAMLVKRGSDGKILRLKTTTERAAFDACPKLDAEARKAIAPYLKERREAFERAVVNNLDLYEKLAYEQIDALELKDMDGIRQVMASLKPFTQPAAPGPLLNELNKRGLITPLNYRIMKKMTEEYEKAARDEDRTEKVDDKKAEGGRILRQQLHVAILESSNALDDLYVEASEKLGTTATKVGISGPALDEIRAMPANAPREARLEAMKKYAKTLTLQQRQHLLKATMDARAK